MTRFSHSVLRRSARRGSVFVLVVAILAVLALLAVTFSYTAQTETFSARNWAEGVQARIGALTGLSGFQAFSPPITANRIGTASSIAGSSGLGTAPLAQQRRSAVPLDLRLQAVADSFAPAQAQGGAAVMASNNMASMRRFAGGFAGGAKMSIGGDDDKDAGLLVVMQATGKNIVEDESAKININALLPAPSLLNSNANGSTDVGAQNLDRNNAIDPPPGISVDRFADFITRALDAQGVHAAVSARDLAEAISVRRYGPDGKPGVAGVDDNGNSGRASLATDGIDNDQDGIKDNRAEEALQTDADGIDNNHDGRIDEPGEGIENDGLDNNYDGRVDEAGEGVDEPAEFSPDIRLPAHGDDRPYHHLGELLEVKGMTEEILDALAPNLTVFSVSRAAAPDPSENLQGNPGQNNLGFMQLDPNTARGEDIYNALTEAYPDLPTDLVGQFVVNLIDRRDKDDIPTEMQLGPEGHTYVGIEVTPYINEVCPDVATPEEDGDHGQYVELINPYTHSIDVNGWRLEGGGGTVYLNGTLPPGGLLVVTDDYDQSNDAKPLKDKGIGSLYDIFGVVATGPDRRVQEERSFNLPNEAGSVQLFDRSGNLIDKFDYTHGSFTGAPLSLQRVDPRLRYYEINYATPLAPNVGAPKALDDMDHDTLSVIESLQNQPFRSALEILLVSSAYAPAAESGKLAAALPAAPTGQEKTWGWRFPSLDAAKGGNNFGIDIADLFLPGAPQINQRYIFESRAYDESGALRNASENTAAARQMQAQTGSALPPALFGRININTASPAVLATLPGMDGAFAQRISELRAQLTSANSSNMVLTANGAAGRAQSALRTPEWWRALPPSTPPRWNTLAEFLADPDLWGDDDLARRIETIFPFSNLITFHTLSMKVTAESAGGPAQTADGRRQSVMTSERIVAGDRGRVESVTMRYLKPAVTAKTDPDLQYASSAKNQRDLGMELMRDSASDKPASNRYRRTAASSGAAPPGR